MASPEKVLEFFQNFIAKSLASLPSSMAYPNYVFFSTKLIRLEGVLIIIKSTVAVFQKLRRSDWPGLDDRDNPQLDCLRWGYLRMPPLSGASRKIGCPKIKITEDPLLLIIGFRIKLG